MIILKLVTLWLFSICSFYTGSAEKSDVYILKSKFLGIESKLWKSQRKLKSIFSLLGSICIKLLYGHFVFYISSFYLYILLLIKFYFDHFVKLILFLKCRLVD